MRNERPEIIVQIKRHGSHFVTIPQAFMKRWGLRANDHICLIAHAYMKPDGKQGNLCRLSIIETMPPRQTEVK